MPEPAELPGRDYLRPLLGAGSCFLFLQVGLFFLIPIVGFFGGPMAGSTISFLLAAVVANALAMAIFESRPLTALGFDWSEGAPRNLFVGMALGAGAALLAVIPFVAAGLAAFRSTPDAEVSWRAICFLMVLLFCGAMGEELAFRGFVLQILVRSYGKWISLAASGALFGWLHKDNPGATPLSILNTALFGILFGFALLRSHDLWLPAGLHFGWNAALPLLGVELSGLTIKVAGYELVWKTGDLWSGGKYGPEAGLTATVVLAILFIAVWKVPVRRHAAYLLEPAAALQPSSA